MNRPAIVTGDRITLREFWLSPAGAPVMRRIDCSDGSPVQAGAGGSTPTRRRDFHVSVALDRFPVRRYRHRQRIGATLGVVGELRSARPASGRVSRSR
jgi:hypothetical protein